MGEANYMSGWASRGLDCGILDLEAVIYHAGRRGADILFGSEIMGLKFQPMIC